MIKTYNYTGKSIAGINVEDIKSFVIRQIEVKHERLDFNHMHDIVKKDIEWEITFKTQDGTTFVSQMDEKSAQLFLENVRECDFLVWDEAKMVFNRPDC